MNEVSVKISTGAGSVDKTGRPCYPKICELLSEHNNMTLVNNSAVYKYDVSYNGYGTTHLYQCNSGFTVKSDGEISSELILGECDSNGQMKYFINGTNTETTKCFPVKCKTPKAIKYGVQDEIKNEQFDYKHNSDSYGYFGFESTLSFSCEDGFSTLVNGTDKNFKNYTSTCLDDGNLKFSHQCWPNNCGNAQVPSNSHFLGDIDRA